MKRAAGIKVSKKDAETARRILKDQGLLMPLKARQNGESIIFPAENPCLSLGSISFEIVEADFHEFSGPDEFDVLQRRLGCKISSYDVTGDLAVLEIPLDFEAHETGLAEALLASKKNLKAVFKKSSSVEGAQRVRRITWLAGEKRTVTVHRELGCQFKLDIAQVFFSPRLSFERQRIRDQVQNGEYIVDMFAGVGPYSIVIAKHRDVRILGIDINKPAIQFFKENIMINKVSDRVQAVFGDCRIYSPKKSADRVIMNLPKGAKDFYPTALETLKSGGGIIHYYGVSPRERLYEAEIDFILNTAAEQGRSAEIIGRRIVRSYSPSEVHVAIDVEVGM